MPEMTIAGDNVDPVFVNQPHRWDIGFIRRFMFVFGSLSSVFDYLTFAVLLWLLQASPEQFRTGWFVESVISATLVVFVLRTRLPLFRSRPSRAMLVVTGVVILITLIVPYSPVASPLGFEALPLHYLLALGLIIVLYLVQDQETFSGTDR